MKPYQQFFLVLKRSKINFAQRMGLFSCQIRFLIAQKRSMIGSFLLEQTTAQNLCQQRNSKINFINILVSIGVDISERVLRTAQKRRVLFMRCVLRRIQNVWKVSSKTLLRPKEHSTRQSSPLGLSDLYRRGRFINMYTLLRIFIPIGQDHRVSDIVWK